ncbi:dTDP-4-dehydrorhamnose reductase [Porphyromonas loveana]|uniref:dTDP-4-dehydrorhamnose reductase n=1 Tax=Porphyromonas loveana TaxID=1884669 RepID=UPI0035A17363
MNQVLVTGANGQLGSEIRLLAGADGRFIFTDLPELDITNREEVLRFVKEHRVGTIINCAAYTAVDKAEDDETAAALVNHRAVSYLAEAAVIHDALLIHVSTDYVFDGTAHIPYKEEVPTAPLGAYGRTKLGGEQAVLASGCRHIILRTSWLYSSFGNNFVKTMLRLMAERDALNVVFDQIGTPTYAADLASFIHRVAVAQLPIRTGLYHYSNEGVCSWFDFAVAIARMSGHTACKIAPCHSDEFPARVKRPHYSVLDKTLVKSTFDIDIPHWQSSLAVCLNLLKQA